MKDRIGITYIPLARYRNGKQTVEAKLIHARCEFPVNDTRYTVSRTLTKLRALMKSYKAMARAVSASGAGSKGHQTLKDMMDSSCPHLEAFDKVLGAHSNVNPPIYSSSMGAKSRAVREAVQEEQEQEQEGENEEREVIGREWVEE